MTDYGNAIREVVGGQEADALGQVTTSTEDKPDNVVRAFDLAKATGVPAPVIYPDLDNFDKQTKSTLSAAIVQSNRELQDYVRRNPLAAKLSNDDWAALDRSTRSTSKLRGQSSLSDSFGRSVDNVQKDFFSAAEAAGSLLGARGMQEFGKEGRLRNTEEAKSYPAPQMITEVQSLGDVGQWMKESLGEFIPMIAPSVAGGLAGAGVGAAVGLMGGPFAPVTVPGGATIGGLIGAFIPSAVQGTGAVQSAIKEKDEDVDAPGIAIIGGTAIGALDTILPAKLGSVLTKAIGKQAAEQVAGKLLAKPISEGLIYREAATGAIKGLAIEGITEVVQEAIEEVAAAYATNKPVEWEQLKTQMIEAFAKGAFLGFGAGGPSGAAKGMAQKAAIEAAQRQNKAMESLEKVRPWIEEGQDPPFGVDPIIDEILSRRSRDDLDALKEAEKDAQASATRERSPELFAALQRQQLGNQQISIDVAGIELVYGQVGTPLQAAAPKALEKATQRIADEAAGVQEQQALGGEVDQKAVDRQELRASADPNAPLEISPDDGILGWVPDLAAQMAVAKETGARVQIPIADWLAYVDPEVSKVLHDFVALRPGGVTKWEREEFSAAKKVVTQKAQVEPTAEEGQVVPPDPVETVANVIRSSAALDRRVSNVLKLKRIALTPEIEAEYADAGYGVKPHEFIFEDQNGNKVGQLSVTEQPDGILYIDGVYGAAGNWSNSFGPSLVRSLLRQLKMEFPNHNTIVAERVSGAREKAGLVGEDLLMSMKFDIRDPDKVTSLEAKRFMEYALGGKWEQVGEGVEGFFKPTEKYSAREQQLSAEIDAVLNQIAPEDVAIEKVVSFDREMRGFYTTWDEAYPIITVALRDRAASATRHEVLHHLREYGYLTEKEWAVLEKAAEAQGWLTRFDIPERYAGKDRATMVEEAIAEAYPAWARGELKLSPEAETLFQKFKAFLEAIRAAVKRVFGEDVTWESLFEAIESGEVKDRTPTGPRTEGVFDPRAQQLSMEDQLTRMEDRDPFSQSPPGMSIERYERYLRAIDKQSARDFEAALKRAKAEETRRQKPEWKKNEQRVRAEVITDLNSRPDIVADEFLRTGMLFDEKVGGKHRMDPELLSAEQRKLLPDHFFMKEGVAPEDVASLTGYPSVNQMLTHVAALVDARGDQRPSDFRRRLIAAETTRRMEAQYGVFAQNVLEEAKDQAISETQEIILHEQTLHFAELAGQQFPISRDALREKAQEHFERLPMSQVSTDLFLKEAGRAGRAVEMAFLKGDPAEAFRQAQRQEFAMIYAREARKVEKLERALAKTAKQFRPLKVKSVAQEYTNYIHALLMAAGFPVKADADQIARGIDFDSAGRSLTEFVANKASYGIELAVPSDYAPGPQEGWNVEAFRVFKTAIDSMKAMGREEMEIIRAGERQEKAELVAEIRANLETMPIRIIEKDKDRLKRMLWRIDAPWTRVEEMLKDMDLRQDMGPLWSAIIPMASHAKHTEFKLLEDLSGVFKGLTGFGKKWRKSLQDTIPQDFIYDTHYEMDFKLTRWNMIRLMMNWGNQSNREKMIQGIAQAKLPPGMKADDVDLAIVQNKLKTLFDRHATKEDWDFVQKMWDVWDGWRPLADTMSRNVSGVGPKWIPAEEFDTPYGKYKGGYMPLIMDKKRNLFQERKPLTGDGPLGPDFFRASTTQTQYIDRTKATYFVDISGDIENLVGRMQQTIHDIAYREFVVNAGKLLYDKEVRNLIEKRYGEEYYKSMMVWLDRVANDYTIDEKESQGWHDILRQFRINLLAAALPLNYSVMFSPGVGTANLRRLVQFNLQPKANRELVMEKSKEIQHQIFNLDRDINEQMTKMIGRRGWTEYQMRMMQTMFKPLVKLEKQFRMVTFHTEYEKQLAAGKTEYEASELADSRVRERHGSAAVVDLPVMMSSKNEWAKFSLLFMGYFTMQRNWTRQIPNHVRQQNWEQLWQTVWGGVIVGFAFNALLFTKSTDDEPYWKFLSRALLQVPLAGVPFGRELFNYYSEGYRSSSPVFSAGANVGGLLKDGWNAYQGKPVKDPVKHMFQTIGAVVGMPGAVQMGRSLDFLNDIRRGEQRPRDVVEFIRGVLTGEAERKKR